MPEPTRRQALLLGGAVAGGAALAGCASAAPAGQASGAASAAGATGTGAPGAAAAGTGSVARYHSRPGLHPARAVTGKDTGKAEPGVLLMDSHSGVGQQGPMILDSAGELVWFRPLSEHATARLRAFNLRVQHYQGKPVLTWWQGSVVHAHGRGHYVLADESYTEIRRVYAHRGYSGDLHDFVLTDAGTALFTCYGTARADLRSLGGSSDNLYYYGEVQEVDLATGLLVFSWRSDQHVPFSYSYAPMVTSAKSGWDQFHLNSVNVAPDGNLIVSSRNTWTVYKVHRKTGKVLWRLGGKHSDFTMGPHTRFAWQHHVTPHPGGILTIFDNEAGDYKVGKHSRGLVLHVDEAKREASFVRQYDPPVHILSSALGSVQLLGNGHALVGWGERPYVTEYAADGSVVFDAHLEGHGTYDYRAFKSAWTGKPGGRPDLVASRSGDTVTAYVSWNGDTQVAHWKLLAGPSADRLTVVETAARRGFETRLHGTSTAAYVAAAGYSGAGRELGRSAPRKL